VHNSFQPFQQLGQGSILVVSSDVPRLPISWNDMLNTSCETLGENSNSELPTHRLSSESQSTKL
jgi:hypothetical protein